ncbi:MAG: photosynthetic reaction center subunit H, partial [Sphingopyxis sp.]|nr:photosynthetic reaction center subunit H [Sphingopyxis sp.]
DTGTNRVLAPMGMAKVKGKQGKVVIDAINAADFTGAPVPKTAGEITFLEEEKIFGYFGGGYLYANAARQDPIL